MKIEAVKLIQAVPHYPFNDSLARVAFRGKAGVKREGVRVDGRVREERKEERAERERALRMLD